VTGSILEAFIELSFTYHHVKASVRQRDKKQQADGTRQADSKRSTQSTRGRPGPMNANALSRWFIYGQGSVDQASAEVVAEMRRPKRLGELHQRASKRVGG
jgi:hypothetical protein